MIGTSVSYLCFCVRFALSQNTACYDPTAPTQAVFKTYTASKDTEPALVSITSSVLVLGGAEGH